MKLGSASSALDRTLWSTSAKLLANTSSGWMSNRCRTLLAIPYSSTATMHLLETPADRLTSDMLPRTSKASCSSCFGNEARTWPPAIHDPPTIIETCSPQSFMLRHLLQLGTIYRNKLTRTSYSRVIFAIHCLRETGMEPQVSNNDVARRQPHHFIQDSSLDLAAGMCQIMRCFFQLQAHLLCSNVTLSVTVGDLRAMAEPPFTHPNPQFAGLACHQIIDGLLCVCQRNPSPGCSGAIWDGYRHEPFSCRRAITASHRETPKNRMNSCLNE